MSQSLLFASVMAVTAGVTTCCAAVLWHRQSLVGARSLAAANIAVAVWATFYAAELLAPDITTAILFGDLKYLGIVSLPPAWFLFALRYTGKSHLVTPGLFAGLLVHPVIMATLLALPATHDLVRAGPVTRSPSGVPIVSVGVAFWPHFAYVTLVLAAATALIAWTLVATSRRYLAPSLTLVAALLVPWVVHVAFIWPGRGPLVDPTPAAYAIVQVAFLWGVLRFNLFNVAPIAREVVLDALEDAVVVVDPYGRVVDLNHAAERLFNRSRRTAGEPLSSFLPDHPELLDARDEVIRRDIAVVRGNTVVHLDVRVSPVRSGSATVPGHVLVMRDVSERRREQRRLEHLVHYDQLTNLPNRTLYRERLGRALALAERSGHRVGVLFLDLDGFKEVNDTLGHEVGDLVLRETAQRLRECLRHYDTAARLGGDEFLILLPGLDDEESAAAVARKVLAAIARPYTAAGRRVRLSASIGIAVAPPNPLDGAELGRLADTAMYQAKSAGRNRFMFAHVEQSEPSSTLKVVTTTDRHESVAVEDPQSSHR